MAILPPKLDKEHELFGYYWTLGNKRTVCAYDHSQIPLSSMSNVGRRQQSSLSLLETLSPEIVELVLGQLDPASLASMRLASTTMNEFVVSLPAFHNLAFYVPSLLRALSLAKCIEHHSVAELHRAMRRSRCEFCHRFGRFLHILQCSRCCYNCLTTDIRLTSIPTESATWALEAAGLTGSAATTKTLTSAWITEGPDFPDMKRSDTKRFSLSSWDEVLDILQKNDKNSKYSKNGHMYGGSLMYFLQQLCFHGSFALPYFSSANSKGTELIPEYGILCRGCEYKMAVVNNDAVHFTGKQRDQLILGANTAYSKAEFDEHMVTCPYVQELKELEYEKHAHTSRWPESYRIWHLNEKRM